MRFNFIKWKIKFDGSSCVFKTFAEFKEHMKYGFMDEGFRCFLGEIFRKRGLRFYPIITTDEEFGELEEFRGW